MSERSTADPTPSEPEPEPGEVTEQLAPHEDPEVEQDEDQQEPEA
jgi:hypothetical protein